MIEQFVKDLIRCQNKVKVLLDYTFDDNYSDKQIVNFFSEIRESNLMGSSALAQKAADYLQLLNSKENYDQVSLDEIGNIYLKLIEISPFDITLYESAFHFFDTVLMDSEKAKEILNLGILKIENRINGLRM